MRMEHGKKGRTDHQAGTSFFASRRECGDGELDAAFVRVHLPSANLIIRGANVCMKDNLPDRADGPLIMVIGDRSEPLMLALLDLEASRPGMLGQSDRGAAQ